MFQHPSVENKIERRENLYLPSKDSLSAFWSLPDSYLNIKPMFMNSKDPPIPTDFVFQTVDKKDEYIIPADDKQWLRTVITKMNDEKPSSTSWAQLNANMERGKITKSISSMFPIFKDNSHSVPSMFHAMDLILTATTFVNPGQVQIIALYHPLFAIAQEIRWNWPDKYGESKLVIMMGWLHIESAFMSTIGSWLKASGWVDALVEAGIITSGKADSLLQCSHINRTRYAHELTVASLYALLIEAHSEQEGIDSLDAFSVKNKNIAQFMYWITVLKLQLMLLKFVASIRKGNFAQYVKTVSALAPWFFTLDKVNYSRWIPVHIRDMLTLSTKNPFIFQNFMEGKFVIHKTEKQFSRIAIDEGHEQNNKEVKGDAGIIGITSNEKALARWLLAGPHICNITKDFINDISAKKICSDLKFLHHEESTAHQKRYCEDVRKLTMIIRELGNPFPEQSTDALVVLHNGQMHKGIAVTNVSRAEKGGRDLFEEFMVKRLQQQNNPLSHPTKRNKLSIFSTLPTKTKKEHNVDAMKNDVALFL